MDLAQTLIINSLAQEDEERCIWQHAQVRIPKKTEYETQDFISDDCKSNIIVSRSKCNFMPHIRGKTIISQRLLCIFFINNQVFIVSRKILKKSFHEIKFYWQILSK